MNLDPQSRAVLEPLNPSGLFSLRQFVSQEIRERVQALRAAEPLAAATDDLALSAQQIAGPTGPFLIGILWTAAVAAE